MYDETLLKQVTPGNISSLGENLTQITQYTAAVWGRRMIYLFLLNVVVKIPLPGSEDSNQLSRIYEQIFNYVNLTTGLTYYKNICETSFKQRYIIANTYFFKFFFFHINVVGRIVFRLYSFHVLK